MEFYFLIKATHILSSTVLFGTGLGTAFFMWRADRTKDIQIIAHTAKNVVIADWIFTLPSVIIQPISGWILLEFTGAGLDQLWLLVSLLLYAFVGALWLPVVVIQIKVRNRAIMALRSSTKIDWQLHKRYMRWWYGLGWPAFISVMAIFYLMVAKPMAGNV